MPDEAGGHRRPGGWRNLAAGAILVLAGLAFLLLAPDRYRYQVGGAGIFLGVFVAVVLGPWTYKPAAPPGLDETRATLAGVASSLDLHGPAYVVPASAQTTLAEDRILLAARAFPDGSEGGLPTLDAETFLHSGEIPALAVVPSGLGLLDRQEEAHGVALARATLAEAKPVLEGLTPGNRLVSGLTVRRLEDTVRIRYRPKGDDALHPVDPGPAKEAGHTATETAAKTAASETGAKAASDAAADPAAAEAEAQAASEAGLAVAGSPVASALWTGVARAMGQPLTIRSVTFTERGDVEMEARPT